MARFLQRRRGVSILEVLFSVLIGTIGLLGAIALLPVASEQARKGRRADAQAIAGECFVNEFKTRRIYDPDRWIAHDGSGLLLHDNGQWKNASKTVSTNGPAIGDSFCVDPRGTSLYLQSEVEYRYFPYRKPSSSATLPRMHRVGLTRPLTAAESGNPQINGNAFTLVVPSLAKLIASCPDDLIIDRSAKDLSLPATQVFNPSAAAAGTKLHRESDQQFSWIATLCPRVGEGGDEYILSIVVLHNRPLPPTAPDTSAEREITSVDFPGGGITGGEVTLFDANAQQLDLRTGDWLMLKGGSGSSAQFRWYKVLDTEVEPQSSSSPAGYTREVSLFGSDWPVALTGSNLTQAVLLTGVVAVYEKTVRIQRSSLWQ